ncbi:MAG: 3TM-type holin [Afipia sp.]
MNILGAMGIGEVIKSVGQIADDLTTSDKERMQADLDAYKAETERMGGQVEINKIEAANSSLFVSGGRPFVVWVCAFALAYASVIEPMARFVAKVGFGYDGDFPIINTDLTMQVLVGVLGLGAYRSFEKVKGVAR